MDDEAGRRLVDTLRQEGICDERVLAAMVAVPRERFLRADQAADAYKNVALPIGAGQTISQPFVVALMLASLGLQGPERVLEVGTGSGYQTALLANLVAEVVSLERSPALAEQATRLLQELGYGRIEVHLADGSLGWAARAPYDAVVVSAGAPHVPDALLEQLGDGGRLVIPIGTPEAQQLVLVERTPKGFRRRDLGPVRFVPLVGAAAWGAPSRNGAGGLPH